MTDTSRPTVEALIARLAERAATPVPYPEHALREAADVLGALLTERDSRATVDREEAEARYWAGAGCEEDDRG